MSFVEKRCDFVISSALRGSSFSGLFSVGLPLQLVQKTGKLTHILGCLQVGQWRQKIKQKERTDNLRKV